MKAAQDFAVKYPTVAAVQAAGWVQATVYTPGQGAHFVDPNRLTGPFDPKRPNFLMYNGTASTANLVGMMFLVDTGGTSTTTTPPAGFPGANDHWHNHGALCVRNSDGVVIGEVPPMSDAQCTSLGGTSPNSRASGWCTCGCRSMPAGRPPTSSTSAIRRSN